MRRIILFSIILASTAFGQGERFKRNINVDKDNSLCVNDGGVEKCLTVDGPTANVTVPANLTVTGILNPGTLADGSVSGGTGGQIVDESITAADLAANSVGASEIATDAVGSAEIATDAVGSAEIATNAVGSLEIATNAVQAAEIDADAVGSSEIATNAVGSSEIATNAVQAAEIDANAVGDSEIANTDNFNMNSITVTTNAVANTFRSSTVFLDGCLTSTTCGEAIYTLGNNNSVFITCLATTNEPQVFGWCHADGNADPKLCDTIVGNGGSLVGNSSGFVKLVNSSGSTRDINCTVIRVR